MFRPRRNYSPTPDPFRRCPGLPCGGRSRYWLAASVAAADTEFPEHSAATATRAFGSASECRAAATAEAAKDLPCNFRRAGRTLEFVWRPGRVRFLSVPHFVVRGTSRAPASAALVLFLPGIRG